MIPSQRGAVRRALSSYSAPTQLRRRRKETRVLYFSLSLSLALSPPPFRRFTLACLLAAPTARPRALFLSLSPQPPLVLLPSVLSHASPRQRLTTPRRHPLPDTCSSFERERASPLCASLRRALREALFCSPRVVEKGEREEGRSGGKGKNEIVKETSTRRRGDAVLALGKGWDKRKGCRFVKYAARAPPCLTPVSFSFLFFSSLFSLSSAARYHSAGAETSCRMSLTSRLLVRSFFFSLSFGGSCFLCLRPRFKQRSRTSIPFGNVNSGMPFFTLNFLIWTLITRRQTRT